jgi:hypothetical protein
MMEVPDERHPQTTQSPGGQTSILRHHPLAPVDNLPIPSGLLILEIQAVRFLVFRKHRLTLHFTANQDNHQLRSTGWLWGGCLALPLRGGTLGTPPRPETRR